MAIITLSTDIGTNDFIMGAFKGQLLALQPNAQIVDITHQLSSTNFAEAAYICVNAFKYYPEETIHIVIVNLFEFDPSQLLLAKYGKQYILCPDNGILTMICKQKPKNVFRLPIKKDAKINTIQCLENIALAAHKLATGRSPLQAGQPTDNFMERYPMRPTFSSDWIEGQIIFIDRFENVVVNISEEEFEECRKGRSYNINFGRGNSIITEIQENYSSSNNEDYIATFNSAGMLELAIKNGNLAGLFGLKGYKTENSSFPNSQAYNDAKNSGKRDWVYQTIRIFFE